MPVLSEKAARLLSNLVPLHSLAERKRASKEMMLCPGGGRRRNCSSNGKTMGTACYDCAHKIYIL